MSQASKQVDWCLDKAKKEIEECKSAGKRPKHRGLLKIEPNLEEAKEYIQKAEKDLEITEYLAKKERGNFGYASIGTIFYSMYHCFLAIAAKFGYETGNQTCTIALMENLKEEGKINIDQKFIEMFKYKEDEKEKKDSIIEMREEFTYSTKIHVDEEKINEFIERCRELIDVTKEIIFR